MKDPAVLFYFQDFLVGTEFMSDEEVGKYIRILCHQADKGSLSREQLEKICKRNIPLCIMEKLDIDERGCYYQERMRVEKEKRVKYSESRSKNRTNICKTYDKHMENENINEDNNIDKREIKFKSEVFEFTNYPETMLNKFCNYWTEKNKSKTKMRFELEKTFEVSRRLVTWASRDKEIINEPSILKITTGARGK
jgi:hypothetical protein